MLELAWLVLMALAEVELVIDPGWDLRTTIMLSDMYPSIAIKLTESASSSEMIGEHFALNVVQINRHVET